MNEKIYLLVILGLILLQSCRNTNDTLSEMPEEMPQKKFQYWEKMTDDGWERFRRVSYEYDEKGQLVQELSKRIVGDSLVPEFRLLREYDLNGNMTRLLREQWEEREWVFVMQFAYEFYSGQIVRRIDSMVNNNGSRKTFVKYNYNDDHTLLSEVSQKIIEEEKFNLNKVVYHYNSAGLASIKEFPIWSDDKWANSRKMILGYDEEGYHISTTRFNWKDGEWIEHIYYDLEVDNHGKRLIELWKRNEEGVRKDFMKVTYEYLTESE